MIATANRRSSKCKSTTWHPAFLKLLPTIARYARVSFRHLNGDARNEAVQETICNACQAFARLAQEDRAEVATARSLARYAVAQVRAGRQVGSSLNSNDVTSVCCQRRNGVQIQPLSSWNEQHGEWQEVLVEDRTVTPAELAASRIDYPAFLESLEVRDRHIAERLARGESTGSVAKKFGVTAGRISQLRRELKRAWQNFHKTKYAVAAA